MRQPELDVIVGLPADKKLRGYVILQFGGQQDILLTSDEACKLGRTLVDMGLLAFEPDPCRSVAVQIN